MATLTTLLHYNLFALTTDGRVVEITAFQGKCTVHDLEVMRSNPNWVELEVLSASV